MEDEIKKDPYQYIKNYYESVYPFIGGKVFSILALLPISLILPKIQRRGKLIRSHLSLILLSPPGSGKTSLCSEFEKITLNPLSTESITPARFVYEVNKKSMSNNNPQISLIVSDIATIFMNEVLIKILENTLEEGYISRNTMRNKKEETKKNVEAISFLSGTPENINDNRLKRGILFRALNLVVFHSEEEHEKIIDFVSSSIGKEDEINNSEIIDFYQDLYKIMEGNHETFNPVEGFIFPEEIQNQVSPFIKAEVKDIFKKHGITFARSVEDFFRIMCSHAFLNIYNRKLQDNKIIITEEDMKVAKNLIKRDLDTKNIILECIDTIDYYGLKTINQLREWEDRRRLKYKKDLGKKTKFIMEGLIR